MNQTNRNRLVPTAKPYSGLADPVRAKRRRAMIGVAAMLCASLAACAIILELGLRVAFFRGVGSPNLRQQGFHRLPHPQLGWKTIPNSRWAERTPDYAVTVQVNAKGLHDREYMYEPSPGVFRIVLLGDSFMEAYQLPEEQSLQAILEESLAPRRVEVINLGMVSYGTGQEYLYFQEEGLRYKPDLVLLAFHVGNDTRNDSKPLETMIWGEDSHMAWGRPYPHWNPQTGRIDFDWPDHERAMTDFELRRREQEQSGGLSAWFTHQTATGAVLAMLREPLEQRMGLSYSDPNVLLGPFVETFAPEYGGRENLGAADYVRLWSEAWDTTSHVIRAIAELARDHGARFALFTVPARIQVDPAYLRTTERLFPNLRLDLEQADQKTEALGIEAGFPVLNLTPAFRRSYAEGGPSLFFRHRDNHWNDAGHRLAAREVARWLDAEQLIPPPNPESAPTVTD